MPDFQSLDAATQRQLDQICDEFDRQLRRSNAPSIQALLKGFDETAQRVLFHELIRLELDQEEAFERRIDQLRTEFPQFRSEIEAECESRRRQTSVVAARSEETIGRSTASDTNPIRQRDASIDSGIRIAHYVLEEVVGSGAFGKVWKAADTKLDRTVAIKLPRAGGEPSSEFLKEAKIAARLTHPNIVCVYDTGTTNGQPFIASEFIDGHPLNEWTKRRKPTSARSQVLEEN